MPLIAIRKFVFMFILGFLVGCQPEQVEVPRIEPTEVDGHVLNALMLHLLNDREFGMALASSNGTEIILHTRTPELTGFLQSHQMRSDTEGFPIPADAERDIQRRNTAPNQKVEAFNAVAGYYTNLVFSDRIKVVELNHDLNRPSSVVRFKENYPKARAWLQFYLPGYGSEGKVALVRSFIGPWAHAATLTAVLELEGTIWKVKWYHVTYYV